MKHLIVCIIFVTTFLTNAPISLSQTETTSGDSINTPNLQQPNLPNNIDTIKTDSLLVNNIDSVPVKKETLESTVNYTAQDSIVFTKGNLGYLYGDAEVRYQEITIKGEKITMDMDSSAIGATFGLDSVGKEFGHPIFDDKGTQYEMKNVRYNFKTEKAFIKNVVTEQGEGY
ncbi:MAG: LPS-assembly protein LptD, partial [Dysgonamonadaceae bacterium]|nr:LPS-assembly protein LptD [Dysgonamonadaceae bacterium]